MSWTFVAVFAVTFVAVASYRPQNGSLVCTELNNKRTLEILIFEYDDNLDGVFLFQDDFWTTGFRYLASDGEVNETNCMFSGTGELDDPFIIKVTIDLSTDVVTVEDGNGTDITAFCQDIVYEHPTGTYSIAAKTVNDTSYTSEGRFDVIWNATCGPDEVLQREITLSPVFVRDVQNVKLESVYNASCWITQCNSIVFDSAHVYNLDDDAQITCTLWFDDTQISKVGMVIDTVTYAQTKTDRGEETFIVGGCFDAGSSVPWTFPQNTPVFSYVNDRTHSESPNNFASDCFDMRTWPRIRGGLVSITGTVTFELDCLSNNDRNVVGMCLVMQYKDHIHNLAILKGRFNGIGGVGFPCVQCPEELVVLSAPFSAGGIVTLEECSSTKGDRHLTTFNSATCSSSRRKRDAFADTEGPLTTSFEVTVNLGEDETLTDEEANEQPEQSPRKDAVETEMACFQKTTFAVLTSIIGLLLILLLVCSVLLFCRVRRYEYEGKK